MYCCLQSIFVAVRGAVMWGGLDFSFFSFFSFCTEHNAYTVFSLSGGLWGRPNSTLAQKTRSCGGMELRGGGAGNVKRGPAHRHTHDKVGILGKDMLKTESRRVSIFSASLSLSSPHGKATVHRTPKRRQQPKSSCPLLWVSCWSAPCALSQKFCLEQPRSSMEETKTIAFATSHEDATTAAFETARA